MRNLDYEIFVYKLEYHHISDISHRTEQFRTEEKAIEFIKENRNEWDFYRLFKIQTAVIDFWT